MLGVGALAADVDLLGAEGVELGPGLGDVDIAGEFDLRLGLELDDVELFQGEFDVFRQDVVLVLQVRIY